MRFVDMIEKKADGGELSGNEILTMVSGFVSGEIPDYQMSAMMMAIREKGMTPRETGQLTLAMMNSGDVADLSDLPGIKLDKHSTGGVGDTTTLAVAPLVAACGGTVAKMSGRGLGHTGGTLDKLESIPGTSVEISLDRFKEIVRENGVAVIGQTADLVPADKKMYALRDVTATVRSIPLIASSIMSKKMASGADAIVLDVKTGSGAFMRETEDAFRLAQMMVDIGTLTGRKVRALVTDMDQPLGMAIGNALEVREAVQLLAGQIPETDPLFRVCILLGVHMLIIGELAENEEQAEEMLKEKIRDGSGLQKLKEMIRLQGGDDSYIDPVKIEELVAVKQKIAVIPDHPGYVAGMNAEMIGTAAQMLGAGRAKKGDAIDPAVGIMMKCRNGDYLAKGKAICTLHVNDDRYLNEVIELMKKAVTISDQPGETRPMIYGVVTEKTNYR